MVAYMMHAIAASTEYYKRGWKRGGITQPQLDRRGNQKDDKHKNYLVIKDQPSALRIWLKVFTRGRSVLNILW